MKPFSREVEQQVLFLLETIFTFVMIAFMWTLGLSERFVRSWQEKQLCYPQRLIVVDKLRVGIPPKRLIHGRNTVRRL